MPEAGEHLHVRKLCRSTMSDANSLMDARLLEPIIAQLRRQVPDLRRRDAERRCLGIFLGKRRDLDVGPHARLRGLR